MILFKLNILSSLTLTRSSVGIVVLQLWVAWIGIISLMNVDFVERIAFPQKLTGGILGGIVVSKHHHIHINNLNYWETWLSSVILIVIIMLTIISPLGSITPVSLHNRTISCMRVAVPCVPNSISPLSMQMLCCQDWQNSRKILDTVGLAHGVCIEKKTHCILSEGTQV